MKQMYRLDNFERARAVLRDERASDIADWCEMAFLVACAEADAREGKRLVALDTIERVGDSEYLLSSDTVATGDLLEELDPGGLLGETRKMVEHDPAIDVAGRWKGREREDN